MPAPPKMPARAASSTPPAIPPSMPTPPAAPPGPAPPPGPVPPFTPAPPPMPPKAAQGIMTKEMQEDDATADLLEGEQPTLRRIFFDFDQTISRCHVFKLLAGWEKSSVPAPFALTDR